MRRWRGVAALVASGTAGVLIIVPLSLPAVLQRFEQSGQVPPPVPMLVLALALQPLILLTLASAVGSAFAPRLGLRSRLAAYAVERRGAWAGFAREIPAAVALGIVAAVAIAGMDLVMQPAVAVSQVPGQVANRTLSGTIAGVLYGGITEEILMRWGLMSTIAWWAFVLTGRRAQPPYAALMWPAILLSAVLFGVGHLPAAAMAGMPLTAPVIARIVTLNAFGGIIFGWLFWRRSLEAAMLAHAVTHLSWWAASSISRSLG